MEPYPYHIVRVEHKGNVMWAGADTNGRLKLVANRQHALVTSTPLETALLMDVIHLRFNISSATKEKANG